MTRLFNTANELLHLKGTDKFTSEVARFLAELTYNLTPQATGQ